MTFKEAHDLLKVQSDRGADTWYGPQLEKHVRTKGHLEFGAVEMILDQLEDHYTHSHGEENDKTFDGSEI